MDSWERFNETLLPGKKAFYSKLNLQDITDKNYKHAQELKNQGDYDDLYVQRDALLHADV